jgi:hypothetical protein
LVEHLKTQFRPFLVSHNFNGFCFPAGKASVFFFLPCQKISLLPLLLRLLNAANGRHHAPHESTGDSYFRCDEAQRAAKSGGSGRKRGTGSSTGSHTSSSSDSGGSERAPKSGG